MARKIRFAFVSVLIGAVMALGGMVSGALAAEKITFFLDWVPYGKHAQFFAGVEYGIYKKYGLDVKIIPGKGSGLSVKTIGAKGADYGHADAGTLIIGRANNSDLRVKLIAMIHHNNLFNCLPGLRNNTHIGQGMYSGGVISQPGDRNRLLGVNHR